MQLWYNFNGDYMKRLVIDTATKYLYVGLFDDELLIEEIKRTGNNDHSAYCMAYIEELLNNNRVGIAEISEIIVGIGPGSYTGVRVGVVIAKTLANEINAKLYKVSSLILKSSNINDIHASFLDARRNNIFSIVVDENGVAFDEKLRLKCEFMDEVGILFGDIFISDDEHFDVSITNILKYAEEVSDIAGLEPNYLKITEAEQNKSGQI